MRQEFAQPDRRRFLRPSLSVVVIAQVHLYFFSAGGVRHRARLSQVIAVGPLATSFFGRRVLSCSGYFWARLICLRFKQVPFAEDGVECVYPTVSELKI
jgi:hypothetical protein